MKRASTDIPSNKLAQEYFLEHTRQRIPHLSTSPQTILGNLDFVQVYNFNTMERAHELIIWARQQTYYFNDLRKIVD